MVPVTIAKSVQEFALDARVSSLDSEEEWFPYKTSNQITAVDLPSYICLNVSNTGTYCVENIWINLDVISSKKSKMIEQISTLFQRHFNINIPKETAARITMLALGALKTEYYSATKYQLPTNIFVIPNENTPNLIFDLKDAIIYPPVVNPDVQRIVSKCLLWKPDSEGELRAKIEIRPRLHINGVLKGEVAILQKLRNAPHIIKNEFITTFRNERNQEMVALIQSLFNTDLLELIIAGGIKDDNQRLKIAYQLLSAAASLDLHSVVHTDLKLENFLISHDNDVALTDFEGAENTLSDCAYNPNRKLTIGYLPPEFFITYNGKLNKHSDLWALGIALYSLATCKLSPWADKPKEVIASDGDYAQHWWIKNGTKMDWLKLDGVHPILAEVIIKLVKYNPPERDPAPIVFEYFKTKYQPQEEKSQKNKS